MPADASDGFWGKLASNLGLRHTQQPAVEPAQSNADASPARPAVSNRNAPSISDERQQQRQRQRLVSKDDAGMDSHDDDARSDESSGSMDEDNDETPVPPPPVVRARGAYVDWNAPEQLIFKHPQTSTTRQASQKLAKETEGGNWKTGSASNKEKMYYECASHSECLRKLRWKPVGENYECASNGIAHSNSASELLRHDGKGVGGEFRVQIEKMLEHDGPTKVRALTIASRACARVTCVMDLIPNGTVGAKRSPAQIR